MSPAGKPAGWGGGGATGPCPVQDCGVYRFDTLRALRAAGGREPSDRGFLTRSDGGPRRAEGRRTPSGPHGRFQPAPGAPRLSAPRGVPAVRSGSPEAPSETSTFRPTGPTRSRATGRRTLPARPPPPPVRSPAGRPPLRWDSPDCAGALRAGAPVTLIILQVVERVGVFGNAGGDRRGWIPMRGHELTASSSKSCPGVEGECVSPPPPPASPASPAGALP